MATLPVNSNQISENIYCNGESYNNIYDRSFFNRHIHILIPWVNNLLHTHLPFLQSFLLINATEFNIPKHQQCRIQFQQNRRKLEFVVEFYTRQSKTVLSIDYKYIFDYESKKLIYTKGQTSIIQGIQFLCLDVLEKNMYTFERRITLFHITLHNINYDCPNIKGSGAFHMKVDSMSINTNRDVMPFRPFILHPVNTPMQYDFFKFNDFNTILTNYFTTDNITLSINELRPFIIRNPRQNHTYLIQNILGSVYDKFAKDILNPLVQLKISNIITPIPIPKIYEPNHPVVSCNSMMAESNTSTLWFGKGDESNQPKNSNGRPDSFGGKKKKRIYTRNKCRNQYRKTRRIK